MKKLLKIIGIILGILLSLLILLYIVLGIYLKTIEVKVSPEDLIKETNVELSDEQLLIVSYIYENQKDIKFHKYPLIVDLFSNKNSIALYVSKMAVHVCSDSFSLNWRLTHFANKRYISRHIDYKTCCDYLFSVQYYGEGVYGLQTASQFFFDKDYPNLSAQELIYLCYLPNNPAFFIRHSDRLKERGERKYLEIYNEPGDFSVCHEVFDSNVKNKERPDFLAD